MPTYNDGGVPYGSQVITINGVSFVAEQLSYTEPTTKIQRMNEVGLPASQVFIPSFANGTATLQLATTATVPPTPGATFTWTRNGGATVGAVVDQVGEPENQKDARKVTISFSTRYAS